MLLSLKSDPPKKHAEPESFLELFEFMHFKADATFDPEIARKLI